MFEQSNNTVVPRTAQTHAGSYFKLHGFSDASNVGLCTAIYVLEYINTQPVSQHIPSKIKNCTPCAKYSKTRIDSYSYAGKVVIKHTRIIGKPSNQIMPWVDSTTVLYWLLNKGPWTAYVTNRIKSVEALSNGDLKYVPTKENPSDLGTRGVKADRLTRFWYEGPSWLGNEEDWPTQPIVVEMRDTQVETMKFKDKVMVTIATMDDNRSHFITDMTSRFTYRKLLRITGWIPQSKRNRMVSKSTVPLETYEIENAEKLWIRIIQETTPSENHIEQNHG